MLIQSALLGAGSLDQRLVKALRARPSVARRYLALEGRRVLAELAGRIPLAAALRPDGAAEHRDRRRITRDGQGPQRSRRPTGVVRRHQALPTADGLGRAGRAGHRQRAAPGIRSSSTCPRPTTTMTRRREVRGKQDPQTLRESALQHRGPSRTTSARCWATRAPPGTAPPAPRCRSAPFGGRTRSGQTPVLCPRGSVSPMTASPALP